MKTIWKYPLQINDLQRIEMPASAQILTVQLQYGEPVLWALVETENRLEHRLFHTVGTGNTIPSYLPIRYIGTYQKDWFVGHVFEQIANE